ncbi:phosphotransferase family protein [Saccharomonospora glauca]|jgi:hypothetical protein|uniref:Phosphotransferase family protein n=1 Tax=Saccharomonospora glauca K62 TaxID=928724 RepID=I1D5Y6_9PSEU|nr:phosphotransferase [Saccharomonospora glauca]EIF00361.1 phosphotransferase family protein [Saccharomonospora glauca K62]
MTAIPTRSRTRDLDLLLGEAARDLVGTVLDAVSDIGEVNSVRPTAVTVRPSGDALVRYAVEFRRRDGTVARETLVAATGSLVPSGAAVVAGEVDGGRVEVGLWRWPHDPLLPALSHVVDGERLRTLLAKAGVSPTAAPTVRVRSYRPRRSAVLTITCGADQLFAKVVPPSELPGLRRRHALLAPHLPVPRPLVTTDDGLVLVPSLPGTPGRTALRREDRLPGPSVLEDLLDRLPHALTTLPSRSNHRRRARHYAEVLALTVPEVGDEATALADVIAETDAGEYPVVPVHGDFYEHQLLVHAGTVTGLLDIDTAGPGERLDDWANFLAHLAITGTPRARDWERDILRHVRDRFDPGHLRPRVASAVLGLATGPFRTQSPEWTVRTRERVALAGRWLSRS